MIDGTKLVREAIYEIPLRGRLDQRWANASTYEVRQLVARRLDVPEVAGV